MNFNSEQGGISMLHSRNLPPVITGTLYLTTAGLISRLLGFIYKIWLGNLIGAEELGIYQLVFPVFFICLSLCGSPFQTAVSKFTAEFYGRYPGKAVAYLLTSLLCSEVLALGCGLFLILFQQEIARYFLLNVRCARLLPCIALSLPFSAAHNCITGWYYGQKKTVVPACSNLLEQGIRIVFIFLLLRLNQPITVFQVACALVLGEGASAFLVFFCCKRSFSRPASPKTALFQEHFCPVLQSILLLIWPLCANRLIMSLLQSVEAVMIPSRLILYGLSEGEALSVYGTLTGMALSFLMFPTAFTGSFSLMLLPDIAKACAQQRLSYLRKASRLSLGATFLMGCFFTLFFFLFGEFLGELFFPGTQAGVYLRSLSFLCPFLYLNNVLISILHGMGRTALTFKNQLIGLLLRLAVTVFLIPYRGIRCYFIALMGSQLLMCGLNLLSFYQENQEIAGKNS